MIEYDAEELLVLLLKKASRQDKYCWHEQTKIKPSCDFFSQHFWFAIHGEETVLVLEGFLEPFEMKEWDDELPT